MRHILLLLCIGASDGCQIRGSRLRDAVGAGSSQWWSDDALTVKAPALLDFQGSKSAHGRDGASIGAQRCTRSLVEGVEPLEAFSWVSLLLVLNDRQPRS